MRNRSNEGKILQFLQGLLITPAIGVAIVGLALQFGPPALAISVVPACARSGLPDLNCALTAFVNIARIIFSVTGSFALLMFIVGGFKILSSAGNDKKVSEGKDYIKNATIGIFIILSAAYVIEYGQQRLTGGEQCKGGIEFPQTSKNEKGEETVTYGCCKPPGNIILVDGKPNCYQNCSQLTTFGCFDPDTRSTGFDGCIDGFKDCANKKPAGQLCCPK